MQSISVKEDNSKINIKKIGGWEEWVHLLQDRDQRRALVSGTTKLWLGLQMGAVFIPEQMSNVGLIRVKLVE